MTRHTKGRIGIAMTLKEPYWETTPCTAATQSVMTWRSTTDKTREYDQPPRRDQHQQQRSLSPSLRRWLKDEAEEPFRASVKPEADPARSSQQETGDMLETLSPGYGSGQRAAKCHSRLVKKLYPISRSDPDVVSTRLDLPNNGLDLSRDQKSARSNTLTTLNASGTKSRGRGPNNSVQR